MRYISKKLNIQLRSFYKDSMGASLLTVLIGSGIVLILAMGLLTLSQMNFQMKIVQQKSDKNFYDAETAINEISLGLKADSEIALKEAIARTECYYATTPASERSEFLTKNFTESFANLLIEKAYGTLIPIKKDLGNGSYAVPIKGSGKKAFCKSLENMTTAVKDGGTITVKEAKSKEMAIVYDIIDSNVKLTGISVICSDIYGYETELSTDICFTAPENYFDDMDKNHGEAMESYSIISDGSVIADSGNIMVNGNVYGGSGIESKEGATLQIAGDKIIAKTTISTVDSGKIIAKGNSPGKRAGIWAKNIETKMSEARSSVASKAKDLHMGKCIQFFGNCYVADDLTVGSSGYDVEIDGNYYGYHTGNVPSSGTSGTGREKPNDGSSISVNVPYADLNIATGNGQTLLLAGTSKMKNPEEKGGDMPFLPMGESLTYSLAQEAYLLPGELLESQKGEAASGRNPMPESEFKYLTNGGTTPLQVNYDKYKNRDKIKLRKFLDPKNPYIARHVRLYTGKEGKATENVVYFYMNFLSSNSASKYFREYMSIYENQEALSSLADILGYGATKVPREKGSRYAGNLLSFSGSLGILKDRESKISEDKNADLGAVVITTGSDNKENSIISIPDDMEVENNINITEDGKIIPKAQIGTMNITENNRTVFSGDIVATENKLTSMFNGLLGVLDENRYMAYPNYDLANFLIGENSLTEVNVLYEISSNGQLKKRQLHKKGSGESQYLELAGSIKGLVVADCDIVIMPGAYVKGLVLTTGNVILKSGAVLSQGSAGKIIEILNSKDTKNTRATIGVSFENWKKN